MNPKILLRIAAGCILFFSLGHSMGHFTRHDVTDEKAKEVLQSMADNKFDFFGKQRSYDEFYEGMSLNLIITLVAFAVILWIISGVASANPKLAVRLLIPILLCVFGFAVTGFRFFFPVPAITCVVATLLISMSIERLRKEVP